MTSHSELSVIVPVYNEETTILTILDQILARDEVAEIIVVNDASKDQTSEKLKTINSPKIKIFEQPVNQGKGAAVIRGIMAATSPYVIIQDADFEYDPNDYPIVLEPLQKGKADVVYGSRFMGTPGQVRYFRHEMGNKILTHCSNIFTDIHLSDMETCYKCFRREVIQNINLESQRFGIEVEMTAKLARARCLRIWEVPISYRPRSYGEGKKITWKDGIAALWHIFRYNVVLSDSKFYKQPWNEIVNTKDHARSPI